MPQIEVQHLRYRGDAAKAVRVEHAIADALRTEVADDGRLVLVRRFALGRIGLADQRAAARAAASAWRDILGGARHGGASGAETANCVWFADRSEARALLMRELARGRTPFAWFWPLAVPEWRGEPLDRWLERRLGEAAADASSEATAALVAEVMAADCVEAFAAIVLAAVRAPVVEPAAPPGEASVEARTEADPAPSPASGVLQLVEDRPAQRIARALGRAIPAALRHVLVVVAKRVELAAVAETLVRALLLRMHPALALAPRRLAALVEAVVQLLRSDGAQAFEESAPPTASGGPRATVQHDVGAGGPGDTGPVDEPPTEASEAARPPPLIARPPPSGAPSPLSDSQAAELRSAAAGLFLAIVPLIRLGWREWLAGRPELLLHQPGARLLRAIADHYRVSAADALWSQLPAVDPADEPPAELAVALPLWRKGLDGWLRRKTRLRLAELVVRQGWILPGVETTFVRFPLEAIEIRLRRLALDRDPGWVDWLGRSYRVVYRDRPLIGAPQ